jgi:hypothetical protein
MDLLSAWPHRSCSGTEAHTEVVYVYLPLSLSAASPPTDAVSKESYPWQMRNLLALLAVGGAGREVEGGRIVKVLCADSSGKYRRSGRDSFPSSPLDDILYDVILMRNLFLGLSLPSFRCRSPS